MKAAGRGCKARPRRTRVRRRGGGLDEGTVNGWRGVGKTWPGRRHRRGEVWHEWHGWDGAGAGVRVVVGKQHGYGQGTAKTRRDSREVQQCDVDRQRLGPQDLTGSTRRRLGSHENACRGGRMRAEGADASGRGGCLVVILSGFASCMGRTSFSGGHPS